MRPRPLPDKEKTMGDTDDRAVGKKRYDLVFACSGACDVGMISDGAARRFP